MKQIKKYENEYEIWELLILNYYLESKRQLHTRDYYTNTTYFRFVYSFNPRQTHQQILNEFDYIDSSEPIDSTVFLMRSDLIVCSCSKVCFQALDFISSEAFHPVIGPTSIIRL